MRNPWMGLCFVGTLSWGQTGPTTQGMVSVPAIQATEPLHRTYHDGEVLTYRMKVEKRDQTESLRYEITATLQTQKNSAGQWIESVAWSDYVLQGQPAPLDAAHLAFRQTVSRSPGVLPAMSDIGKVPDLVGPVTDLLTFYVDLFLASRLQLRHAGDHQFLAMSKVNTWAATPSDLIAEDAVDFDMRLATVDAAKGEAVLIAKHVPPKTLRVKLPARWMQESATGTPANWVQVLKRPDGTYRAEVGIETFDVEIHLDLRDGRILRASLDNPVEVCRRDCRDATLLEAGEPIRYKMHRHIELVLQPAHSK